MTSTEAYREPEPAPASLGPRGTALWAKVVGPCTLDPHEAEMLEHGCRLADRLDALDAAVTNDGVMVEGARGSKRLHPAIAEHRQATLALARVMVALRLPAGYADGGTSSTGTTPSGVVRQAQRRVGIRGFQSMPRGA